MVSISRAAPDASRMCKVAAMISGPIPSPGATVMGVLLDIGKPKHIGLRRVAQGWPAVSPLRASVGIHEGPRRDDFGGAKSFHAQQVVITGYDEARLGGLAHSKMRLSSGSSQILTATVGVTTIHRRHKS